MLVKLTPCRRRQTVGVVSRCIATQSVVDAIFQTSLARFAVAALPDLELGVVYVEVILTSETRVWSSVVVWQIAANARNKFSCSR
jgi:hypothetical protein